MNVSGHILVGWKEAGLGAGMSWGCFRGSDWELPRVLGKDMVQEALVVGTLFSAEAIDSYLRDHGGIWRVRRAKVVSVLSRLGLSTP